MIKNDKQLASARTRKAHYIEQIDQLAAEYSGLELELLVQPLRDQVAKLDGEIEEYERLIGHSLAEAIDTILATPTLIENIGELLARLRIAAGFTQEQLAAKLNWKQSNLSRFESPNYSSQTLNKIVEFSGALGIWLHVFPSANEAQVPEADTEVGSSWERIPYPVIPIEPDKAQPGYGTVDNTISKAKVWITDASSNTDVEYESVPQEELEFA